ncbi:MAG: hypothetical protein HYU28_09660 [Actinobacteria bacterium]|nr:hypothetical protein [Actinomycetota bacterium]
MRTRLVVIGAVAAAVAVIAGLIVAGGDDDGDSAKSSGSSTTTAAPAGTDDAAAVSTYRCPDEDPIGDLLTGDQFSVLARDESGEWLLVGSVDDPSGRVWVKADDVETDADAELPVAACDDDDVDFPDGFTPVLGRIPGQSAFTSTTYPSGGGGDDDGTPPTYGPGGSPDGGESGSSTTTPPGSPPGGGGGGIPQSGDGAGPEITDLSVSESTIYEDVTGTTTTSTGDACTNDPMTSDVSVRASDPAGVSHVVVDWKIANTFGASEGPMDLSGGRYRATVGPFGDSAAQEGSPTTITFQITARDADSNASFITGTLMVKDKKDCPT